MRLSTKSKRLEITKVPSICMVLPTNAAQGILFSAFLNLVCRHRVKGKAIPVQAWTISEGSRRLRLPDFKRIGA